MRLTRGRLSNGAGSEESEADEDGPCVHVEDDGFWVGQKKVMGGRRGERGADGQSLSDLAVHQRGHGYLYAIPPMAPELGHAQNGATSTARSQGSLGARSASITAKIRIGRSTSGASRLPVWVDSGVAEGWGTHITVWSRDNLLAGRRLSLSAQVGAAEWPRTAAIEAVVRSIMAT